MVNVNEDAIGKIVDDAFLKNGISVDTERISLDSLRLVGVLMTLEQNIGTIIPDDIAMDIVGSRYVDVRQSLIQLGKEELYYEEDIGKA